MAVLENKAGQFVLPSDTAGTKTLANTAAQMPENLRMFMPDPEGSDSYPIITYSWLLLYKNYQDKNQAARVKSFVEWGLKKGQEFAPQFGYTPLPQEVVASAVEALGGVN
jgi:phosphate transport system substrate-binding protein